MDSARRWVVDTVTPDICRSLYGVVSGCCVTLAYAVQLLVVTAQQDDTATQMLCG